VGGFETKKVSITWTAGIAQHLYFLQKGRGSKHHAVAMTERQPLRSTPQGTVAEQTFAFDNDGVSGVCPPA